MSFSENSKTIVIYSTEQEFEPHPLKFYADIPSRDVNALVKETIENIKNHINKPQLKAWDASQGTEIDCSMDQLCEKETIFLSEVQPSSQVAETFENALTNSGVQQNRGKNVRANVLGSQPETPTRGGVASSAQKLDDSSFARRGEGPIVTEKVLANVVANAQPQEKRGKAMSAAKMSISAAKENLACRLKTPSKENVNDENYHVNDPADGVVVDPLSGAEAHVIQQQEIPQNQDQGQGIVVPSSSENLNQQNQQDVVVPVAQQQEEQKVPERPPTGSIGTVSIHGSEPDIYCHHTNTMPFSYMITAMPGNYDPKLPPPTYLPHSVLADKKTIDRTEAFRGLDITNTGLLKLTDPEILKTQKGLITEVLQSLFKSIAEGRGVVGVSLPIRVFEPRSLIERLCDFWTYVPNYLVPATRTNDPVERIKKVISMFIAALHLGAGQLKPFNPLLGETYQAHFPNEGITIDLEHTSHHPPIANFLVTHKDFRMWGQFEFIAKLEGLTRNVILMMQEGATHIQFSDGQKLTCYCPYLHLEGMMHGDRTAKFVGNLRIIDDTNRIKAVVKFGDAGHIKELPKKRTDVFSGKLYRFTPPQENAKKKGKTDDLHYGDLETPICDIYGSWLEYLKIGDEETFNVNRDIPTNFIPVQDPLPSDARFREDLIWVKRNNKIHAQQWKLLLEVRQRYEKKLRQDGAKIREKQIAKHGSKNR